MALPEFIACGVSDGEAAVLYSQDQNHWSFAPAVYTPGGGGPFASFQVSGIDATPDTVVAATLYNNFRPCSLEINRGTWLEDDIFWQDVTPGGSYNGFQNCNSFTGTPVSTNGEGVWLIGLGLYFGGNLTYQAPNVLRSTNDGITWDQHLLIGNDYPGTNISTRCFCLGNGIWLAGGWATGTLTNVDSELLLLPPAPPMYYSTDTGLTWTPCNTPLNTLVYPELFTSPIDFYEAANVAVTCITYDGVGRYVAGVWVPWGDTPEFGSELSTPCLMTSSDGINWEFAPSPFDGPTFSGTFWSGVSGVAYGKGTWLAIGNHTTASTTEGMACVSPDGINWTVAPEAPPGSGFFNFGSPVGSFMGFVYYTGRPANAPTTTNGRGFPAFSLPGDYRSKQAATGWGTFGGPDFPTDNITLLDMTWTKKPVAGGVPIRQFPRDDNLALGTTRIAGLGIGQPSSGQSSVRQGFRGVYW